MSGQKKSHGPAMLVFIILVFVGFAAILAIPLTRGYFETLSAVLPGVKLYINTGSSSDVQMLLPLESLMEGKNG